MTAKVVYWVKKNKREVKEWIVSIYDNPIDITNKDKQTMARLMTKLYKGSKANDKKIVVTRVLEKKIVGYTTY